MILAFVQTLIGYFVWYKLSNFKTRLFQAKDLGPHKRFYNDVNKNSSISEILGISTNFEWKNNAYVKPPRIEETIGEMGLAFLKKVEDEQDPETNGMNRSVGGAQAGALRDIQRAQQNPELRINHADIAVIRNERVEGEEFYPFQVVQILEVNNDADDVIISIVVQEMGGMKPRGVTDPCHKKQTYKPRYKGIDPLDKDEKDVFLEGFGRVRDWMVPQYLTIDPLTIVEWGKKKAMLTDPAQLNAAVLKAIHHQPRVEWTLPAADLVIHERPVVEPSKKIAAAKRPAAVKQSKKTAAVKKPAVVKPSKKKQPAAVKQSKKKAAVKKPFMVRAPKKSVAENLKGGKRKRK